MINTNIVLNVYKNKSSKSPLSVCIAVLKFLLTVIVVNTVSLIKKSLEVLSIISFWFCHLFGHTSLNKFEIYLI